MTLMCYKCEATTKNPLPYCFHDSSNPGELVECSSGFDSCYSILTGKNFNFQLFKTIIAINQNIISEQDDGQDLKLSGCTNKINRKTSGS